jgi:GNAT superfamily N-acetyltransferase
VTTLRTPGEEDIGHVVRVVAEHWPEPVDDATIRRDWASPRVNLETDVRVGDGVYVLVEDMGEERAWIEVHGPPREAVFQWAEERAAAMGAARLFSGAWSTNEPMLHALRDRGYAFARRSARMEIDLAEPVEPPVWPTGIAVRTFEPGDERLFYDIQEEAFRDMWEPMEESYEEWAHWQLGPSRLVPELWLLAHSGSEGCGIAICHPHETLDDLGWVGILAVRRKWRRRGIARALLLHSFERFRERGLMRAGLGVDSASITGANTLYESVGMRATQEFHIHERTLA